MHTHICVYTSIYTYTCIHVYKERERERERQRERQTERETDRERKAPTCICVYTLSIHQMDSLRFPPLDSREQDLFRDRKKEIDTRICVPALTKWLTFAAVCNPIGLTGIGSISGSLRSFLRELSHSSLSLCCHRVVQQSVLQCIAVYRSVLQCVALGCTGLQCVAVCCSVLQCVVVCCIALHWVAVCCTRLQYVAVCGSVLQYVAVCCNVAQCALPSLYDY